MKRPAPLEAAPARAAVAAPIPFAFVFLAGLSACGGGGAPSALGLGGATEVELFPLEIQPLGEPLEPLGLLEARTLEWRANQPGEYRVTLRAGADEASERVLATGIASAYETVRVTLRGAELCLTGLSPVVFSLTDSIGRSVSFTQKLELKGFDVLPLGAGEFTDLAFDALREELVVADASAGELRVIDVDVDSAGYGLTVGTLASFAAPGSLRVALGGDGRLGYVVGREELHPYDRDTLELLDPLALPAATEPAGLTLTPDAGRVYLSHPGTLLIHHADDADGQALLEGTGIVDLGVERGELAATPDGARLLYAWEGLAGHGLWAIGSDPHAPEYHELVVDHRFAASPQAPPPALAIAVSGRAAYALGLDGLAKIDLEQPELPIVATRDDLTLRNVVAAGVEDLDFVIALDASGAVWVLDSGLELLGGVELPPGLVDRAAVDRKGGRLFVLRATAEGAGELVVLPLE